MRAVVLLLLFGACCGDRVSYTTVHGMQVAVGRENAPGPRRIELLTDATMNFWRLIYPHKAGCIYSTPAGVYADFVDTDEVEPGIAGLCYDDLRIIVANLYYRDDIFIHEFSHAIFFNCMEPKDGNGDHSIFREADLCRIQTECI